MEHGFEAKMQAHMRGARVLGDLALSFGVALTEIDYERILTVLAVSREVEEASLREGFYAGLCHKALVAGEAYGTYIPRELAARFKMLHDRSDATERQGLDGIVHGVTYHTAVLRQHRLNTADVHRESIDHKRKISEFQAELEDDARYHAAVLALPLVGDPRDEALYRDENASRVRYNAWLEDFYVAYEHVGALTHLERDLKKGRHSVESVGGQRRSQAGLACQSLVRCFSRGEGRTAIVLLKHGVARAGRRLTGRI